MKNLVFTLISLFSLASFAADKMNLTCVTEFPTTSFVVRELQDLVVVEVFHHNGTQYMPITDSLLTPNDVGMITQKAKILSSLPSVQRYEWTRDKCTVQDDLVKSCFGNTDMQNQNGHKVKAWAFSISHTQQTTPYGAFNSHKVSLDLSVDGQNYSVPMRYEENECVPEDIMAEPLMKKIKGATLRK